LRQVLRATEDARPGIEPVTGAHEIGRIARELHEAADAVYDTAEASHFDS
jgi:hypothetical protein